MKTKIVHLLQSDRYSGAENVVCQIIELFQNDYEMIYVCRRGPIENILISKGIEYYLLDTFSQSEIDEVIEKIKPDIIHAHDFSASVKSFKYKTKVISHIHNDPLWLSKVNFKTIIYALACLKFKKIIGVSSAVREEFIFKRIIKNKFYLLPNCINANIINDKSNDGNIEQFDLLFVGRLSEQKNPLLFLEIVNHLKKKGLSLQCKMIGEGPLRNECYNYIQENNLTNNIEMVGFTENPYIYMKSARVLVITSKWEGFGLVSVEAMLLGKPVVCCPVGGLVDIIPSELECYANTVEEFAVVLGKILNNDYIYECLSESVVKCTEKYTNIDLYKKELREIYSSILL